ncbi:uncharacterized protein LOC130614254 [Hydractinia symbiolongicarpus]|uniref:uncharacterized protein LOC130614254 n=1 Tax=Hydractinia symbiolongicarpus TaxID=13093 RepID=UPI002549F04F|nr:uncharacterized protein LOC130614254 [Hydractinia symbiolongicarpus]
MSLSHNDIGYELKIKCSPSNVCKYFKWPVGVMNIINTVTGFMTLVLASHWGNLQLGPTGFGNLGIYFFVYSTWHAFLALLVCLAVNMVRPNCDAKAWDFVLLINMMFAILFLLIGASSCVDTLREWRHRPFGEFSSSCEMHKEDIKCDLLTSAAVMSFLLIIGCIIQAILHYCMIRITPTTSSTITIEATTFDNTAETYPETSQTNTQHQEPTTHENVEATKSLPETTSITTQQQEQTAIYENV